MTDGDPIFEVSIFEWLRGLFFLLDLASKGSNWVMKNEALSEA
jgi:hypothetical protein